MALNTYSTLVSGIGDWLNRTDSTTLARIPDWIALAEAEMKRRLRQSVAHVPLSLDAAEVALPTAARSAISLSPNTGTAHEDLPLDPRTEDEIKWLRAKLVSPGKPRYFAVVARSLLLAPVPDDTYPAELTYIEAFTPILAADSGTWTLLAAAPDMYLYGALTHAAPFLEYDASEWRAMFDLAIEQVNAEREMHVAEPLNQPVRLARVFG